MPPVFIYKEVLMLYTIPVTNANNETQYIFLFDTETKSGFNEVKNNSSLLSDICNRYHVGVKLTKDIFRIASQEAQTAIMPLLELTETTCDCFLQNDFLTMQEQPKTMRDTLYKQLQAEYEAIPVEQREQNELSYNAILFPLLQNSLNAIMELKTSSKIDLSNEFFASEELSSSMCSKRPVFNIPMTENQSSIQENNESELNIALPPLMDIRESPANAVNILALINVIAPYRRLTESVQSFSYHSKYHTPYFRMGGTGTKVNDELAKSKLSADFKWVYGNSNNNLLPLQQNEQKLFNNLKTLYFGDISEYVYDILTGLLNTTTFGMRVNRLVGLSKENALEAAEMIPKSLPDFITFSFSADAFAAIPDGSILTKEIVSSVFSETITLNSEQVKSLITEGYTASKVIDCDHNLIKPHFQIANEKEIINLLIENGYISLHFRTFLMSLIQMAYRINWGHTGATHAITPVSTETPRKLFDDKMSEFLDKVLLRVASKKKAQSSNRFPSNEYDDYEDDMEDNNDPDGDEVYTDYPWYTSSSTRRKIRESANGYVDNDIDISMDMLDTESKIVERWRVVNGEAILSNYVSNCFFITGDVTIFALSFIKLLRWGYTRKPTFLVFPEFPQIKTVFDLNESAVSENLFIVDESDVVKHNGCDYTLTAILRSKSKILNTKREPIVGFLLTKDYGKVKKHYIASWSDLQQEYKKNPEEINIDPLNIPHQDIQHLLQDQNFIEKVQDLMEFEFYISDEHIKQSHEFMCQASELSECRHLITADVTRSSAYKSAIKAETITTNKERQYAILNDYIHKLARLYSNYENDIEQITTVQDLINLLKIWERLSKQPPKKEHNDAVAEKTLQRMQLGGTDNSVDTILEKLKKSGKYALVVDKDCDTPLTPLTFPDHAVNQLALKYYNRVVMTLLRGRIGQENVAVITDITDFSQSQLALRENGTPSVFSYENILPFINVLKKKDVCNTKNATFYIQSSLKGKLL